tara:strand:+ start:56 stop:292 length:237 start_codon:yes stop_codon:yes gene_type:complete
MYIIINNTTRERLSHEGNYPGNYIEDLLNKGDDVIVISLYSNTIKIPQLEVINGLNEWSNKEYSLCMDIIAPEALVSE